MKIRKIAGRTYSRIEGENCAECAMCLGTGCMLSTALIPTLCVEDKKPFIYKELKHAAVRV